MAVRTLRNALWTTAVLSIPLGSIFSCSEQPVDPIPRGTGIIEVTVSTTGANPDPDGYLATLDGTGLALALPATGSAGFLDVEDGDHTVALGGLAANCA